ncbi:hypothetical protein OG417_21320 [Actinoallomurus sp. NBC_01490]|uniref:hypothetical protein n=1 Tax=Actinoallomurus sp. NBC_01490 TaxID=2903557 RepID=UPI002E31F1FF|nr:hypothetical protein [Actinoallomurus sp. NBC_01490]
MDDRTASGYDFTELAAMLRTYAHGIYPLEAATELLIAHQTWLLRTDFTTGFITVHHDTAGSFADVDFISAAQALDAGDLPCSGSEAKMLRIAASLASNTTITLGQAVGGLDSRNTSLVLTAIAHANGYGNTEVRLG